MDLVVNGKSKESGSMPVNAENQETKNAQKKNRMATANKNPNS
jgi:hypothetical protein